MEEKLNEDIVFEETTEPQVKKSSEEIKKQIDEMEELFKDEPQSIEPNLLNDLANLDLSITKKDNDKEITDDVLRIVPTLTEEQIQQLVDYVKGTNERPEFMDIMLTQTNAKLTETLKVMTVLQLLRLPQLQTYLNSLHNAMLDPAAVKDMSYEDMSAEAVNIQKEISEILNLGLKVIQSTTKENQIPTKIEKLAAALANISDSTRQRIEEIIAQDIK